LIEPPEDHEVFTNRKKILFAIAFTVFQAISEKIIALFLYKTVWHIFNHGYSFFKGCRNLVRLKQNKC